MSSYADEKVRDPYDGLRPWSAISHGIGIAMSAVALICLMFYARNRGFVVSYMISLAVFGCSMIALYTASTLYHSLRTREKGRIVLRKTDHLMIYLLIAGTYTPLCVIGLGGTLGTALLCVIWALALIGSIINTIWIKLPRWLTSTVYIVMGWIAVVAIYPLSRTIGFGVFWLILGGVLYTIGGVLYAIKWPGELNPRFGCHEVFHVFILLGSICHYIMMFYI